MSFLDPSSALGLARTLGRMTRLRAVLGLLFFAAHFLAIRPCAAQRIVRVGVFQAAPLTFSQGDRPSGLFIDILEEVAKKNDWKLLYEVGAFEEQLRKLRDGRLDVMPSIAHSQARAEWLDYTQEPVAVLWGEIFVHQGSAISNLSELSGKRIALMTSDINGENFRDYAERFDLECELIAVPSLEEVFALVRDGGADAGVAPNVFGYRNGDAFDVVGTPVVFSPIAVHFAAGKGLSKDVLQALDSALAAWKEEQGSFYRQRLSHWLGGQAPTRTILPKWLVWGSLVVLGFALVMVLYSRILESRVEARTRELARSEFRFGPVFNNQFQLAGLLSPSGELLEANAASLELVGANVNEVRGKPFWECPWWSHDRQLMQKVEDGVRQAAQGKFVRFDAVHLTPDGERRAIDFSIKPIFDESGRVQLLVPEGRDVSERLRLEESLRQAQKMEAIGTLAGGIAHDFNNILTVIAGSAELAQMYAQDRGQVSVDLDNVMKGCERARELVQQILTFSRKRPIERGSVNIAELLAETLRLLRATLPTTIEIEQRLEPIGAVYGDAVELQRVLMNLATNAFHAMPRGGVLRFLLCERDYVPEPSAAPDHVPGRYAVLSVEDTGIGMTQDTLSKVFEPYFTTKGSSRGTGLGLAVAHGIIRELGGWIEARSGVGKGTRFDLWLRLANQPLEILVQQSPVEHVAGDERILVVDDEAANVALMVDGLSRLGYRADGTTDPTLALQRLLNEPDAFDAVLSDLTMPKLTGLELAKQLKDQGGDRFVVFLWSGFFDDAVRREAELLGIKGVLSKPISPKGVASALRAAFGGRHTNPKARAAES